MASSSSRTDDLRSPGKDLPSPEHHSTPDCVQRREKERRDSLFGFNNLDSPLVLSPVATSPTSAPSYCSSKSPDRSSSRKVLEQRRNPYRRLLGTYDVPIYEPASRKPPPRKKPKVQSSDMEEWVAKMNKQFDEVDSYELVIK